MLYYFEKMRDFDHGGWYTGSILFKYYDPEIYSSKMLEFINKVKEVLKIYSFAIDDIVVDTVTFPEEALEEEFKEEVLNEFKEKFPEKYKEYFYTWSFNFEIVFLNKYMNLMRVKGQYVKGEVVILETNMNEVMRLKHD